MRPVRALSFALAVAVAAAVGAPTVATAQAHAAARSRASQQSDDSVTRIVPRYPMRGSDALLSRDGYTALVLTDRSLVLQLTHEGVDHLTRRASQAEREVGREVRSQPVATAVAALVGGLVRTIADRGLEYDLRDLGDARYVNRRIVLRRLSGDEVFGNVEIDGTPLMEGFDAGEARAFLTRVQAAAARSRQSDAR